MRQTFHIFKKDVRYLRWEIALVLSLVTVFAYSQTPAHQNANGEFQLLNLVLIPLSWIYVTGRVVHAEALPGNKQFWLTRPYSRTHLIMAKMLFLLAFITLPIMISDVVILRANGFAPAHHLSGLIWEQVIRWMVLVAPAMAVSVITSDTSEQVLSILLGLLLFFGFGQLTGHEFRNWGAGEWIRTSIACGLGAAGAASIIVSQYAWRKTPIGWVAYVGLLGLGSILLLLPPPADRYVRSSPLIATLDPSIPPGSGTSRKWPYAPMADLPLRLADLPDGLTPWLDDGQVTVPGFPNAVGTVDWEVLDATRVHELIIADRPIFGEIKHTPVRVHTFVDVTLVRNKVTTPISHTGSTMVPGVGLCSGLLSCVSPFRTPGVLVVDNWTGAQPKFTSRSPFPAEFLISPLVTIYPRRRPETAPSQITVTTAEPVEQRRFDFDLDNVRLADFEFHR